MADLRYTELKFEGKIYNEQWKIDEILIKNKFNWMVNAEIKNARLEIFENTLVWNAGIWYNGSWYFGVWRDGEWKYGTWQNGVWYNGVWRDGTFKSGIIYKGKFFKGKIENGEIRGGQFINMEIDPKVVEYTNDEYQVKKEDEQKEVQSATATDQPTNPDQVKVHSTQPPSQQVSAQPKIQQEKKEYKNIKTFESFKKLFEAFDNNLEIGDYIIYKPESWKGKVENLQILSIHNTPGPIGSKWKNYGVNIVYDLIDNKLEFFNNYDPKEYEKEYLEKNCLYITKDLEDAKKTIFIIKDKDKYNL